MDKNMMTHCPTRMREVFAFLLLITASSVIAQEDCDNIVTIPELAAQIQEVQVDTIIMLSEGNYEVQLSNGTTTTRVFGCTDSYYVEYYASANVDDGSCSTPPCTDENVVMDGYTYSVVEIGDQCWFAENLRTTKFNNGSSISRVTNNSTWYGLASSARCEYDNNQNNVDSYGRMYNGYAMASISGLCPTGWHIPSWEDWMELKDYLGSQGFSDIEGTALKATSGWSSGTNGTDDFGFSGIPSGQRPQGGYYSSEYNCYWWSSSATGDDFIYFGLRSDYQPEKISYNSADPRYGLSVRCIRDAVE